MTNRFDLLAGKWDDNPVRVALARAVVDTMTKAVPLRPGMRIVDYGAGTGLVTLGLAPYATEIVAVDTSSGMLTVLNNKIVAGKLEAIRTVECNAETGDLPVTGFDLAASSMTMHHVADVPRVIGRLAATLGKGGCLAIADLDPEDGSFHGDVQGIFHHGFDRKTMCHWFTDAGLKNVHATDAHVIEKKSGTDGSLRHYSVFLVTGFNN